MLTQEVKVSPSNFRREDFRKVKERKMGRRSLKNAILLLVFAVMSISFYLVFFRNSKSPIKNEWNDLVKNMNIQEGSDGMADHLESKQISAHEKTDAAKSFEDHLADLQGALNKAKEFILGEDKQSDTAIDDNQDSEINYRVNEGILSLVNSEELNSSDKDQNEGKNEPSAVMQNVIEPENKGDNGDTGLDSKRTNKKEDNGGGELPQARLVTNRRGEVIGEQLFRGGINVKFPYEQKDSSNIRLHGGKTVDVHARGESEKDLAERIRHQWGHLPPNHIVQPAVRNGHSEDRDLFRNHGRQKGFQRHEPADNFNRDNKIDMMNPEHFIVNEEDEKKTNDFAQPLGKHIKNTGIGAIIRPFGHHGINPMIGDIQQYRHGNELDTKKDNMIDRFGTRVLNDPNGRGWVENAFLNPAKQSAIGIELHKLLQQLPDQQQHSQEEGKQKYEHREQQARMGLQAGQVQQQQHEVVHPEASGRDDEYLQKQRKQWLAQHEQLELRRKNLLQEQSAQLQQRHQFLQGQQQKTIADKELNSRLKQRMLQEQPFTDSGLQSIKSNAHQDTQLQEHLYIEDLTVPLLFKARCINFKYPTGLAPLCVHRKDEMSTKIESEGFYEQVIMDEVAVILTRDTTLGLIDIGAGIGMYSIAAALMGKKVLAVEPLFRNYRLLQKTAQLNHVDKDITLVAQALDNESYVGQMSYADRAGGYNNLHISKLTPEMIQDRSNIVHVTTLDSIVTAISFKRAVMKLDVNEGSEVRILQTSSTFFDSIEVPCIITHWSVTMDSVNHASLYKQMSVLGYHPHSSWNGEEININDLSNDMSFVVWQRQ